MVLPAFGLKCGKVGRIGDGNGPKIVLSQHLVNNDFLSAGSSGSASSLPVEGQIVLFVSH